MIQIYINTQTNEIIIREEYKYLQFTDENRTSGRKHIIAIFSSMNEINHLWSDNLSGFFWDYSSDAAFVLGQGGFEFLTSVKRICDVRTIKIDHPELFI